MTDKVERDIARLRELLAREHARAERLAAFVRVYDRRTAMFDNWEERSADYDDAGADVYAARAVVLPEDLEARDDSS